ncbi:MAG: response regulator [Candidatus Gastranaerophilales bacterium]|nr:response regulator [Candidatus Gastranaerophilales bacterium]
MNNISKEQLEKLFELSGVQKPDNIDTQDISKLLVEIEKKLSTGSYSKSQLNSKDTVNILIVDDLELSLHQLNLLLSKSGYNVQITRSKEEAVQEFNKNNYHFVFVDLFLPESEDGLELVKNISNLEKCEKNNTKIVVISGTEDKTLINKCFENGASEFIAKTSDWHKYLLKYIRSIENKRAIFKSNIIINTENESRKIISVTLNNINNSNKEFIAKELEQELIILANSGMSNIIIDFKNVSRIDSCHTEALIAGYRACLENKGNLKLCNINQYINETLSYVFLNNVIKVYKDKESAISDF